MKKIIFLAITITIFFTLQLGSRAESKNKNTGKNEKTSFSREAFENTLEKLPPNYRGNSYIEIVRILKSNARNM